MAIVEYTRNGISKLQSFTNLNAEAAIESNPLLKTLSPKNFKEPALSDWVEAMKSSPKKKKVKILLFIKRFVSL